MATFRWQYLDAQDLDRVAHALHSWREPPDSPSSRAGVLALVCEHDAARGVARLQQAARELSMPLAGAVVPGVVAEGAFRREGAVLLDLEATTPRRLVALPHADGRSTDAALEALADFAYGNSSDEGGDTLMMLVDAMTPDVASVLDRLYAEVGDRVNYAGACVGSETFQSVRCVFDAETFIADAMLAIVLPRHPGVALVHHYEGHRALWIATASSGSHVKAIDGRPALDVYRQLMRAEYGIELDRDNFYQYAVHFPFALDRAQGEPLVRIPVKVEDDGSVVCSGEVPENALVSVVRAVQPGSLATPNELGARMRELDPQGVLAFYCAGRLMHLESDAGGAELRALVRACAPSPTVGALCLGEIGAGSRQYPAFHNAAVAALPWT